MFESGFSEAEKTQMIFMELSNSASPCCSLPYQRPEPPKLRRCAKVVTRSAFNSGANSSFVQNRIQIGRRNFGTFKPLSERCGGRHMVRFNFGKISLVTFFLGKKVTNEFLSTRDNPALKKNRTTFTSLDDPKSKSVVRQPPPDQT